MDQKKKSTKKLWGKVSSYVSKKIKRNSTSKFMTKVPKDAPTNTISNTNIVNDNDMKTNEGSSSTNTSLDNGITKKMTMKRRTINVGINERRNQINISSIATSSIKSTNIFSNTTNKVNSKYSASSNIRPTSPSSYLLKSTLSNHIHKLANEYSIHASDNNSDNGDTGIITSGNTTDILYSELNKLALKKLESQTKVLLSWENSAHHNVTNSATSVTISSSGNKPINDALLTDPIDSLISMLNKTESKLSDIETDLIPQSNALKQTIKPLTPIYNNLEELLLHFQNQQMLIDRLEYVISKVEVREEVMNVLQNMQHYISMATPLPNDNPGKNVGNDGTNEKKKNDIDDIMISAVSETLKKLDEIKKELSMFKHMRVIKDSVNELQQYLVEMNTSISNNLFSKDELAVVDAHSISNNSKDIQSQYLKINSERPNLVLLYKMLFSVRAGD